MDSSALLATCAGSGVTLVAIIGGFLLTKYLSISSEIAAAQHQIDDIQERLTIENWQRRLAEEDYGYFECEWELEHDDGYFDLFLEHAATHPETGVTDDVFASEFSSYRWFMSEVLEQVRTNWNIEARRVMEDPAYSRLQPSEDQPTWFEFRRDELPDDLYSPAMWEYRFHKVAGAHIEQAREKRLAQDKDPLARMRSADLLGFGLTVGSGPAIGEVAESFDDAVASRERRRHEARQTVEDLNAQLGVALGRRDRVAQPDGALAGLILLVFVFVLTVVPSLLLLAPEPADLTRAQSAAVLAAYFAGVAMMFGYFFTVARGLSPKRPPAAPNARNDAPGGSDRPSRS